MLIKEKVKQNEIARVDERRNPHNILWLFLLNIETLKRKTTHEIIRDREENMRSETDRRSTECSLK